MVFYWLSVFFLPPVYFLDTSPFLDIYISQIPSLILKQERDSCRENGGLPGTETVFKYFLCKFQIVAFSYRAWLGSLGYF